jgi:pectin methylesterase-like acyl-CoA thioesterase
MRMRMLAIGLVLITAALGASPAVAARNTLIVDDDRAQCRNARFTTIQAAVAAARAGDTIRVCAGTYTSATIDKPLRLDGSTDELNSRRCLDRRTGEDPTRDSIVNGGAGAPAFRVAANDVEIRGFSVQNATNEAGISVPVTFSGTRIHRETRPKGRALTPRASRPAGRSCRAATAL